jgi:hypothetical protein
MVREKARLRMHSGFSNHVFFGIDKLPARFHYDEGVTFFIASIK